MGAVLMPALVSALVVIGTPAISPRAWFAALAFVAMGAGLIAWIRRNEAAGQPVTRDLWGMIAMVGAVCGLVALFGGNEFSDTRPFRNGYLIVVGIMLLCLGASRMFARGLLKPLRAGSHYGEYLRVTELFQSRGFNAEPNWRTVLAAVLGIFIKAPLHLLLPACAWEVITGWGPYWFWPFFGGTGLVLIMAGLNSRLNTMWSLLQKVFFRRGALVVSVTVIALGVLRLQEVPYVTAVLDSAQGYVVVFFVCSAYLLVWWFDYWSDRMLVQELLMLIDPNAGEEARIDYPISPDRVATKVVAERRGLQVHGSRRYLVTGYSPEGEDRFQAWEPAEMFERIAAAGSPGGRAEPNARVLSQRIDSFRVAVSGLLIVVLAATLLWISRGAQWAELKASREPGGVVTAARLLLDPARCASDQPVYAISSAGGGTRAALYTAAVLEGLAKRGHARGIVLTSGVSGGGASLAYFGARRPALVGGAGWDEYFGVMSAPFIQDVIDRAIEWRLAMGMRMGNLLDASFKHRWKLETGRNELGELCDFGLLLNSAIAGEFNNRSGLPLIEAERRFRKDSTSKLAGGRMVYTNLAVGSEFAAPLLEGGQPLPVLVSDPAVRIETASALNANFPPVFANAAVDLDQQVRYWVTDGGAADNRGAESLLLAIRDALRQGCPEGCAELPNLEVVMIDGGALSDTYSQDRGVGTALAAGGVFASQLSAELAQQIRGIYAGQRRAVRFHYLPMPRPLRRVEPGSFGTHWMLQSQIVVRDQLGKGRDSVTMAGEEMIRLLRALHGGLAGSALETAEGRKALQWAGEDDEWRRVWQAMR